MNKEHIFFVEKINEIEFCGDTVYEFIGSDFKQPTDFKRIEYPNHNLRTCDGCQKRHHHILSQLNQKFNKFPFCCSRHTNLARQKWYNRDDYKNAPTLVADKIMFTWHHIFQHSTSDDWKTEIFDYIEYVVHTFGSFPTFCGEPLFLSYYLYELINLVTYNFTEDLQKKEILSFLNAFLEPKSKNKTDINILIGIYNDWLATFPFEISFFAHLKPHFKNNLPLSEKTHNNKYLGLTTFKLVTKERLIEILTQTTDKIIREINTSVLYKEDRIGNVDKIKIELALQQRQIKIKEGYINKSKDPNTRYRKILKEWLKDELEFINNIREPIEKLSTLIEETHKKILDACYLMQENKLFWNADENTRTKQILDILSLTFPTKDQSMYGESEMGKKQGSIDGVITWAHGEIFIEAFNLTYINKNIIERHINKLELNYDSKGIPYKYILVYCNIKDGIFQNFYQDYTEFIKGELKFKHQFIRATEHQLANTNIRLVETSHLREAKEVIIRHILLKMPTKNETSPSI